MIRIHTVWNAKEQRQEDILFTDAEELERDAEEAADLIERVAVRSLAARLGALQNRLIDGSLSYQELVELLRLERGI